MRAVQTVWIPVLFLLKWFLYWGGNRGFS